MMTSTVITVEGRECYLGVDVSNWQTRVDHAAVAASGRAFLVAKATQGTGYTDPYFIANREGTRAAGMLFGAYHWLIPGDAAGQARHYLTVTLNGEGCDFMVLDAEQAGITAAEILEWCRLVEEATGKIPVIYCGAYTDPPDRPIELARYTPWLAAYPTTAVDPDPTGLKRQTPPAPWGRWDLWQFSSSGRVPGVGGNCDVNVAIKSFVDSLTGDAQEEEEPMSLIVKDPDGSGDWEIVGLERRQVNEAFGTTERDILMYLGAKYLDDSVSVDGRRFWMNCRTPVVIGGADAGAIADAVVRSLGVTLARSVADELAKRLAPAA